MYGVAIQISDGIIQIDGRLSLQASSRPMLTQTDAMLTDRQPSSASRKGVAAVETAFCLPVIVLIVFGGIQAANMIFLKQAITAAAYEGALFASKPEGTQTETVSRVQTILDARNIQTTTITAGSGGVSIDQLAPGQSFSIRIRAAASLNSIGPQMFAVFNDIEAEVFARKL